MRRVHLLALSAAVAVLTACPSPPKNGECKSSADCASQAGFGKVCVSGQCAECAADGDCKAGFVCTSSTCQPRPAPEASLPSKPEPRAECVADGDCGGGKGCQAGKCVSTVDASCADAAAFTVHFGFDQAAVSGDAPDALKRLAECLKRAPARRVQVDGHCDDRGTSAYNLALGKRRAEAVKKYVADLGASGAIDTNTYGEDKPLCREASEDCWARNRRAEFKIER